MSKVESRADLLASLPKLSTDLIAPPYQQHHNIIEGNHAAAVTPSRLKAKKSFDFASYYIDRRSSLSANATISSLAAYTPPPSPNRKSRLRYSIKRDKSIRTLQPNKIATIDSLAIELTDMYENLVQKYNEAEAKYKKLDNAMKTALDAQSNIYEQQLKRLKQQLEFLQKENSSKRRSSDLLTDIIHDYTDTNEYDQRNDPPYIQSQYQELLESNERTMQSIIAQYIRDLEKERLENKRLKELVVKQDRLISILDDRLKVNSALATSSARKSRRNGLLSMLKSDKLLEAQLELQGIELEDKKKLLSVLIDERDSLIKQVNELKEASTSEIATGQAALKDPAIEEEQQRDSVNSIDILAKIAQTTPTLSPDLSNAGLTLTPLSLRHKHSCTEDQLEAQLSPPPRSPLPPTPTSQQPYQQRPTFLAKSQSQRIQPSHTKQLETHYRRSMQEHHEQIPTSPTTKSDKDTNATRILHSKHCNADSTATAIPPHLIPHQQSTQEADPSNKKSHRHSLTLSSIFKSFKRHAYQ